MTLNSPKVGGTTCASNFKRVDLPAPFLPIIATVSPFLTEKVSPFSAYFSINKIFKKSF